MGNSAALSRNKAMPLLQEEESSFFSSRRIQTFHPLVQKSLDQWKSSMNKSFPDLLRNTESITT